MKNLADALQATMGGSVNMSAVIQTHVAIMAFVRFTTIYSSALVRLALLRSCAKCHAPQVCILIAADSLILIVLIHSIHFYMLREGCPPA